VKLKMNFKKIFELYKNRTSSNRKIHFIKLVNYFIKLKIGEITKKIYYNNNNEKLNIEEYLVHAENIIDSSIRKTLEKINIDNIINIKEEKGFENIGVGMIFTPAMFGNLILLTQKKSTIYFKTKEKKDLTLDINLFAIIKISGHIMFEEKIIDKFLISTLTEYKNSICIDSDWITENISKITIIVDRCWSANYIDSKLPTYPLGVGIQSMNLN
jgi:hypothetical protein